MRSLVGLLFSARHSGFHGSKGNGVICVCQVQWQPAPCHGQGIIWLSVLEFPDILVLSFEVLKIHFLAEILLFLFLANNYMLRLKKKRGDSRTRVYFHRAEGKREARHLEGLFLGQGGVGGLYLRVAPSSHPINGDGGDDVRGAQVGTWLLPAGLLVLLCVPNEAKERWTPPPPGLPTNIYTRNASRLASSSAVTSVV